MFSAKGTRGKTGAFGPPSYKKGGNMGKLNSDLKKANMLQLLTVLGLALIASACSRPENRENYELQIADGGSIVGGQAVEDNDPVISSTVVVYDKSTGGICTGSLVTRNLVLTAAHCTGRNARNIVIGFGKELDGQTLQFRQVIAGATHPLWAQITQAKAIDPRAPDWGDMALLRFEGDVPEGFAPTAVLAKTSSLQNGQRALLAGYGKIDTVRNEYASQLMKAVVVLSNKDFSPTEIEFEQYQGRGACQGDSGGPAFVRSNGRLVLIGVTSRVAHMSGARNCDQGSIYSSVPANIDWIKQTAVLLNQEGAPSEIAQPGI